MAEAWRVTVLDELDHFTGKRLKVASGSLEWSQFRAVPGTGTLRVTSSPEELDLLNGRLKIDFVREGETIPMGIWLFSASTWDRTSAQTTTELKLADKTELLNAPVGRWLTIGAGTTVTSRVASIVRERGGRAIAVTPSSAKLRTALSWRPDDTWLTVVNDMLRAAAYSALWTDMTGRIRVEPYLEPEERPIVATFGGEPDDALMVPNWSDEAEVHSLPTGFRWIVEGDQNKKGFIGRADLPEHHPLSAASRGREILQTDTGEATSQTEANRIAASRLQDALQVTRRVPIQHPVDTTELGDVVKHRPLDLVGPIVERTIELGIGPVVTDTIRRIYRGGELPW